MNHLYEERYDNRIKIFRKIYSLDNVQLIYLSEFSNGDRKILKYSIDVEKDCDSHYEIDEDNAAKLAIILQCSNNTDDIVSALIKVFSKNDEHEFVKMLEDKGIKFQPYHFDDWNKLRKLESRILSRR